MGVPEQRAADNNQITPIPPHLVPSVADAKQMYEAQGGQLTEYSHFGRDPLRDRADLVQRRDQWFMQTNPSYKDIFSNVVSDNGQFLEKAILDFISYTDSLKLLL